MPPFLSGICSTFKNLRFSPTDIPEEYNIHLNGQRKLLLWVHPDHCLQDMCQNKLTPVYDDTDLWLIYFIMQTKVIFWSLFNLSLIFAVHFLTGANVIKLVQMQSTKEFYLLWHLMFWKNNNNNTNIYVTNFFNTAQTPKHHQQDKLTIKVSAKSIPKSITFKNPLFPYSSFMS